MEIGKQFVREYLKKYSETQGVLPDKLESLGKRFREQGYLTQDQLYEIAYESSTRSAYHVRKNRKKFCEEVTSNVLKVEGDFSKIGLITLLSGFKAPTASCVLTALDPETHAVVDTRVWASLERAGLVDDRKETFKPADYVEMIDHIRKISEKTGFSASEVGYALFAHDFDVRDDNLH